MQENDYKNAELAYIKQLHCIVETPEQFKNFARFYNILEKRANSNEIISFQNMIHDEVQKGRFSQEIEKKLASLLISEAFLDNKTMELIALAKDDKNFHKTIKIIDRLKDKNVIQSVIRLVTNKYSNANNQKTREYLVSVAAKYELDLEELELLKKILADEQKRNPTVIRALFRLCRKLHDYSEVEKIFDINASFIKTSDFNVQYELVYYFEYINNDDFLERTLKCIQNSATNSIPIARTLYNFYLKFNRFDEAMELSKHIKELELNSKSARKRIDEQFESEQEVWGRMQALVSEQEHNRQMIAMRDLLKGFSHELGQPVTNIRYSVQLYQMKAKKEVNKEENTEKVLKLVLEQTERIGNLLDRFRPIVSSKSEDSMFNLYERIDDVFGNLYSRLDKNNISYKIMGTRQIQLWGDPVQFDQVFYNLILNAMQAIAEESKEKGLIKVIISKKKNNDVQIIFYDNGPGIPSQNAKKIFEPFYSTKDPTIRSDGGEGLGLFIVWNVLKMFNGDIKLDTSYVNGAKFIIIIKGKDGNKNE